MLRIFPLHLLLLCQYANSLPRVRRQEVSRCPNGYTVYDSSCYRFMHSAFTWPEAYAFCKALGASLVTIQSAAEDNFLKTRATEITAAHSHTNVIGFWISATDSINENDWKWAGLDIPMDFTDWAPNEPDSSQGRDCAGLWKAQNFQYGAWDCRTLLNPICELNVVDQGVIVG